MSRLSIDSLERVRLVEWERRPDRGPLYIVDRDGMHERLTQRHFDRGAQMLGFVLALAAALFVGVALGTVHARVNPVPMTPVAEFRQ